MPAIKFLSLAIAITALCACSGRAPIGKACFGDDEDSLVESLGERCRSGDTIATKHPGYFCNFNYAVAYNDFNSAFCVYNGEKRDIRGK